MARNAPQNTLVDISDPYQAITLKIPPLVVQRKVFDIKEILKKKKIVTPGCMNYNKFCGKKKLKIFVKTNFTQSYHFFMAFFLWLFLPFTRPLLEVLDGHKIAQIHIFYNTHNND